MEQNLVVLKNKVYIVDDYSKLKEKYPEAEIIELGDKEIILLGNSINDSKIDISSLHKILVDTLMYYAKYHNLNFDTFYLFGSCTEESINEGKWLPDTDSSLELRSNGETLGYSI